MFRRCTVETMTGTSGRPLPPEADDAACADRLLLHPESASRLRIRAELERRICFKVFRSKSKNLTLSHRDNVNRVTRTHVFALPVLTRKLDPDISTHNGCRTISIIKALISGRVLPDQRAHVRRHTGKNLAYGSSVILSRKLASQPWSEPGGADQTSTPLSLGAAVLSSMI